MVLAAEAVKQVPGADITVSIEAWIGFLVLISALLLVDLLVFNRKPHEIQFRAAALESAGWIGLGVGFTFVIWAWLGGGAAGQYITGYLIEKSLSVDNVFVWAVIFSYFAVPGKYQHRVLFWGIFGALVLRAIFIFAGIALLNALEWVIYLFGAFLLFTAWRIWRHEPGEIHPENNPVLRLIRRTLPVTTDYQGQRFFWREGAKRMVTPLFVVLILLETTDVVFAVDSIPAILAVTRSQFLVFSSNAFAILGLRSLYFLLAGSSEKLVYLNEGLAVILAFVGTKMLLSRVFHIPTWFSLTFIAGVLLVTVLLSLRTDRPAELPGDS
jgi:TerC family integral membrane protein